MRAEHLAAAARGSLGAGVERINSLNVYPVPDGDTGTNMLLTLESVLSEVRGKEYETVSGAARAVSRAALMGARGNSGVILSQMIRGATESLPEEITPRALVKSLEGSADRAYSSTRNPVEGTMLTVAKDAARAARETLEAGGGIVEISRAAAEGAHSSVQRTPELLAVLAEAGVVDAGGLGVAAVLDGLHAALSGEEVEVPEIPEQDTKPPDLAAIHASEEAWGYCTEFIVTDFSGDAEEFEEEIQTSGKSVLVVSDDDLVKVHLHTQDPGATLSYAGRHGRLSGVKIDDMEAQVGERMKPESSDFAASVAVVVASRGEGNRALFEGFGAVVIEGGQGSNPSASDFAAAVERAVEESGAGVVILLPNNKNVVPTAEQVGGLVEAEVRVIPTTTLASGLCVMVGFDARGEPEEVAEEMDEILSSLRAAEVTRAVRDASVDGHEVPEGAYIGLLDGRVEVVEEGVGRAALGLAKRLLAGGADVLTVVRGEGVGDSEVEDLVAEIEDLGEDVEVDVKDGGQPLYPIQMAAE